jgi:hypothetical protein
MTELMPAATEKKVQLQLQLQASDALKVLMSELVKPELRRDFARHAIYLALYTDPPVETPIDNDSLDGLSSEVGREVADYTKNIEDVSTKTHMFNRALHLAPEIGYYEHENHDHGVNLRFKLAVSAIEAKYLFAPPFDETDASGAYIVTHLPRVILDSDMSRSLRLSYMRHKFTSVSGVDGAQPRAPDLYHVTRPMIKKRISTPLAGQ